MALTKTIELAKRMPCRLIATIGRPRNLALCAVVAGGLLPAVPAQAQWYGPAYVPATRYQYVPQYGQPYAVEVAPNTYVIRRPAPGRAYRHVRCRTCGTRADVRLRAGYRTTKIVRDPPIVIETRRVVDDPPRVIERRHVVEDAPASTQRNAAVADEADTGKRGRGNPHRRVIHADAEVTIIEPDRMIIRLTRKPRNSKSSD